MSTNSSCSEKVRIYSWGANSYGELGHCHTEDLLSPTFLREESGSVVIAAGGGHTFFYHPIADEGSGDHVTQVKGCGWNTKGQLGLPTSEQTVQEPQEITALKELKIKRIACGWDFTLCLTQDGTLTSFGSNAYGQLGIGDVTLQNKTCTHELMPVVLAERVIDVTAGLRHAAAITESGKLFTWGAGKKGQLGITLEKPNSKTIKPTEVDIACTPVKVLAGAYHTVVLSSEGEVFIMGDNKRAQTTQHPNSTTSVSEPYKVPRSLFNDEKIIDIRTGWTHILAKAESGTMYTWGRNDYGQLGRMTVAGYDPIPAEVKAAKDCIDASCGSEHNLVLQNNGTIVTWGWNEHGICGTGDEKHVLVPHKLEALFAGHALSVRCGMGQSFVICKR